jgi:hypothetical protein
VYLELRRAIMSLHEADDVSPYREALDMIDKIALAPDVSARLIADRMENLS